MKIVSFLGLVLALVGLLMTNISQNCKIDRIEEQLSRIEACQETI